MNSLSHYDPGEPRILRASRDAARLASRRAAVREEPPAARLAGPGLNQRMRFRPYPPRKGDRTFALDLAPGSAYILEGRCALEMAAQHRAHSRIALLDHLPHQGRALSASARALLFDLGGVVMSLHWDRMFAQWAADSGADPAHLRSRYRFDLPYERHERGEIHEREYYEVAAKLARHRPRRRGLGARMGCRLRRRDPAHGRAHRAA